MNPFKEKPKSIEKSFLHGSLSITTQSIGFRG
jgi:hypothetical protein